MKRIFIALVLASSVLTVVAQDRLKEVTNRLEYLIAIKDYQKAKKEITQFYASQPEQLTELNIVENYEVGRIERRVDSFIEYEDRVFSQVRSSKSISKCNDYLDDYPYGKYRDEVIKIKRELLEKEEKVDYEKAKNGSSEEVCRQYLAKYPSGKYRVEVNKLLVERIENNVYEKAKKENTIGAYERYIELYPYGKYATEANTIIGNAYIRFGNNHFDSKDYANAIAQYKKYLNKYPGGFRSAEAKTGIRKCERELNKRGANFLGLYYDKNTPYGLYFGGIKRKGASYYASLAINEDFLQTFNIDNTIDNQGITSKSILSNTFSPVQPNVVKIGNFSISNGFAFPIYYPVWGYVGSGLAYVPYMQEYNVFNSFSSPPEKQFFRNTDKTEVLWYFEGGLKVKLAKVAVLRYGIRYFADKSILHQWGLGFQLRQK